MGSIQRSVFDGTAKRLSGRGVAVVAFILLCTMTSLGTGVSANHTVGPTGAHPSPVVSSSGSGSGVSHAGAGDFYHVRCHSHTYELSATSFAALWTFSNMIILLCSFSVFLKHCCYKTFTTDTSKGY